MTVGLDLPLVVDELGKAKRISGSEQLAKLLAIALQSCSSENPFQDLGLDERIIFSIKAPNIRGRVRLNIVRIFQSFERNRRARLRTLDFESSGENLKCFVAYQDLETTKNEDIILLLPVVANVRPRVSSPER